MTKLGISTKCFGGIPTDKVTDIVSGYGYSAVELCLCQSDAPFRLYNAIGVARVPDTPDFLAICEKYRSRGLEISSLCVGINLWCGGEDAVLSAKLGFASYLDLALAAGIDTISTELGFSMSSRPIRGTAARNRSYTDTQRHIFEQSFCFASLEAAKRGLTLSIEPNESDPVYIPENPAECAAAYCEFIERIEKLSGIKDTLRLTLCPFPFGDVYDKDILESLRPRAGLLSVKERVKNGRFFSHAGTNAGCGFGISEWKEFFSMFDRKFAIAEYADDRTARHVFDYVSGAIL